MQLTLEHPDHEFFLRGIDGAAALVNERTLTASFVLAPDALIEGWPVHDAKALTIADLEPLLAMAPEVVILGTGSTQVFPTAEVLGHCLGRRVGLEVMSNSAAARTFNVLAGENRKVVAGFILPG